MIRGIRNNNPCNIRLGPHWNGLMPRYHMNPLQEAETAFCVFETPMWGFRAAAIVMRTYCMDGFNTLRKIINRWAPPVENNTAAYLNDIMVKTGINPDMVIEMEYLVGSDITKAPQYIIIKSIASHETAGSEPLNKSFDPFWRGDDLAEGIHRANQ